MASVSEIMAGSSKSLGWTRDYRKAAQFVISYMSVDLGEVPPE